MKKLEQVFGKWDDTLKLYNLFDHRVSILV